MDPMGKTPGSYGKLVGKYTVRPMGIRHAL